MRRMSGAAVCLLALGAVALFGGRNGAAAQKAAPVSPLRSAGSADLAAGTRISGCQCAWCHGTNGVGGTGPGLQIATLRHAANDQALVDIVRAGIPGTDMPGFTTVLTDRTAWQTAAYVRTLGRAATKP